MKYEFPFSFSRGFGANLRVEAESCSRVVQSTLHVSTAFSVFTFMAVHSVVKSRPLLPSARNQRGLRGPSSAWVQARPRSESPCGTHPAKSEANPTLSKSVALVRERTIPTERQLSVKLVSTLEDKGMSLTSHNPIGLHSLLHG
jgi:hypothetical protein